MNLYTINYIKTHPIVYNYLRDNSSWYKYLNRSESYLSEIEEQAKSAYKLRPVDKIEKLTRSINLISSFMDVLK
mgnify:CR=1 FL=1